MKSIYCLAVCLFLAISIFSIPKTFAQQSESDRIVSVARVTQLYVFTSMILQIEGKLDTQETRTYQITLTDSENRFQTNIGNKCFNLGKQVLNRGRKVDLGITHNGDTVDVSGEKTTFIDLSQNVLGCSLLPAL